MGNSDFNLKVRIINKGRNVDDDLDQLISKTNRLNSCINQSIVNTMLKVGSQIKSTSLLDGTYFENATIIIVEKNSEGAVGFVLNRPFGRSLNELQEFKNSKPFPLLEGGPVDQEHIYILHSRPDLIKGSQPISNNKYFGGDIQEVINAINVDAVSQKEIQLFLGYCGWDADELEEEIKEGSWTIVSE